jgi:hypothetical protein
MYGFNDICWQTSASRRNSIWFSAPVTTFSCQSDSVNTCRLTLIQVPSPQVLLWHGIGNQRLVTAFQTSLRNTMGIEMLEYYRVRRHTVYWENIPYHIKQYRTVFCYPTKITNLIRGSHSGISVFWDTGTSYSIPVYAAPYTIRTNSQCLTQFITQICFK